MRRFRVAILGLAAAAAVAAGCSDSSTPAAPTAPAGSSTSAADGSTLKATAPVPVSPVNDAALNDVPTLTASAASTTFASGSVALQYRFEVFNAAGTKVQDSGLMPGPSFKVTASLDFNKRFTWHVRAEYQNAVGPWSATASFISPQGGYLIAQEAFDPLVNGITVGERIGNTTFVPGDGIKLNDNLSYVRYTMPQTITAGEFSMEVKGLKGNSPGDKSKVLSMSSNAPDFITDPYRTDIQYRGTTASPPNSITFRMLYGSADDTSVRYEPSTATRFASVYNLDPNQTYYWKLTWGSEVRLVVKTGGLNGPTLYDHTEPAPNGKYNPVPHYLYLGAPTGRSGAESASIPGTIYRNVWIGVRSRAQSID